MVPEPANAAAAGPREWLALPDGGVRPVVSVPRADGTIELVAYSAWLTRSRPACLCGMPRLGSGRTCGSADCVARLRVEEAGGAGTARASATPGPDRFERAV